MFNEILEVPNSAENLEYLPKTSGNQKRVGVLTLPFNTNIGGNLQGYALMETLRQLGHMPVLINRRHPPKVEGLELPEAPRGPLLGNVITIPQGPNKRFIEEHITPITGEFLSSDQLSRSVDRYAFDAVIVGSDQVWRPMYAKTLLADFFLGFLPEHSRQVKRISYAASFGAPKWEFNKEQTDLASTLARRFDAISVREDSAVELCQRNLGVEAKHVLDPTMLLTAEHYAKLAAPKAGGAAAGQLLAYVLDRTEDKAKVIQTLSNRLSVGAYSTNGLSFEAAATALGDKSVECWLASIHDAAFVITDSFHGTVFSILFNRPFIAYGNPKRGMARFTSLMKMVGLEDRLVVKSSEIDVEKMLQPIDWAAVNRRLEALRVDSKQFLISALQGDLAAPATIAQAPAQSPAAVSAQIPTLTAAPGPAPESVQTDPDGKPEFGEAVIIDRPIFSASSDVWRIQPQADLVSLVVAREGAGRGHFVWCDLPFPLARQKKYRLVLTWRARSTTKAIDVFVRNKESGKFQSVGKVSGTGDRRQVTIDFVSPGDGFTQFMVGASQFTGKDAGAEIISLSLQEGVGEAAKPLSKYEAYAEASKRLALIDSKRYADAFIRSDANRGIGIIRARLMFYAHALEKGLSRVNFRPRFGESTLRSMATEMTRWLNAGRSPDDQFFKTAAATAHAYFERHRQLEVDASDFLSLFDEKSRALIMQGEDEDGGVLTAEALRETVPESNRNRSFIDVVFGRRSVRDFTPVPVDDEDIRRAVRIAQQAPSVCNRQAARVHLFEDQKAIRAALDLQGGFKGYAMPPKLLLVTTDLSSFLWPKERNQGFVDGGLFMMTLLLGLEQVGLGACPLNTSLTADREDGIRKILDIPESEIFISFIAVGHFDPSVLTPRSKRIAVDDVLVPHRAPSASAG